MLCGKWIWENTNLEAGKLVFGNIVVTRMEGSHGGEGYDLILFWGGWNYQNLVIDWMSGMRERQDPDDC